MKTMRLHALGAALRLDDVSMPEPGPGQVRLRVHACGVNFADTLMVQGKYQEKPALPFAPGMELCGTIDALGPDVTGVAVGQRVISFSGAGGFAEAAIAPAATCVPVPDTMPDTVAAGFAIAYGTSDVALNTRARLQEGEHLLVLGAAGGIGLTAVELGKLAGARVIAVARGGDRLKIAAKAGADHVLDSDTADIRASVKALGGADVVYDPVGGALFDAALRATNPGARLLPLGFASGEIPQIPANILLVKNLTVHGVYWGGYARLAPKILRDSFARLFDHHAQGRLQPHISHTLPLERANDALALLRDRKATGKVVLTL